MGPELLDVAGGGMLRAGSAEWELIHTSYEKTQIQPHAPHGLELSNDDTLLWRALDFTVWFVK